MINSNHRVCLFGKTGSGKTVVAKYVLWAQYPVRKIFFDPKCENHDLRGAVLVRNPEALERVIANNKPVLYQPDDLSFEDFNEVCGIVFSHGNFTLFCDEVSDICTPSRISHNHRRLLSQGRSRGIGVVSCSTRPRDCNSTIISEAEHHFVFRLFLESDVDKIKMMLPKSVANMIYTLPPHCFLYFNTNGVIKFFSPFRIKGL